MTNTINDLVKLVNGKLYELVTGKYDDAVITLWLHREDMAPDEVRARLAAAAQGDIGDPRDMGNERHAADVLMRAAGFDELEPAMSVVFDYQDRDIVDMRERLRAWIADAFVNGDTDGGG